MLVIQQGLLLHFLMCTRCGWLWVIRWDIKYFIQKKLQIKGKYQNVWIFNCYFSAIFFNVLFVYFFFFFNLLLGWHGNFKPLRRKQPLSLIVNYCILSIFDSKVTGSQATRSAKLDWVSARIWYLPLSLLDLILWFSKSYWGASLKRF